MPCSQMKEGLATQVMPGSQITVQGAGWVGGREQSTRCGCCPRCSACRQEPLLFLTLLGVVAGIALGSLFRLWHPSKDAITLIGQPEFVNL